MSLAKKLLQQRFDASHGGGARMSVSMDADQIRRFQAMCERTAKEVGKDTDAATMQCVTSIYAAVRSITPKAGEFRRLIANPEKPGRYSIAVWNQTEPAPRAVGDFANRFEASRSKSYLIPRRGFARIVWSFSAVKAGIARGTSVTGEYSARAADQASEGRQWVENGRLGIEFANKCPYIETLDRGGPRNKPAHIGDRGMEAGLKRHTAWLDHRLKKTLKGLQ